MTQSIANHAIANRAPAGLVSGVTATAIVIADMVGIGVFTSLGFQVGDGAFEVAVEAGYRAKEAGPGEA